MNEQKFLNEYINFQTSKGLRYEPQLSLDGHNIGLFPLYSQVKAFGGYQLVTSKKKWNEIMASLNLPDHQSKSDYLVKNWYQKNLFPYELFKSSNGNKKDGIEYDDDNINIGIEIEDYNNNLDHQDGMEIDVEANSQSQTPIHQEISDIIEEDTSGSTNQISLDNNSNTSQVRKADLVNTESNSLNKKSKSANDKENDKVSSETYSLGKFTTGNLTQIKLPTLPEPLKEKVHPLKAALSSNIQNPDMRDDIHLVGGPKSRILLSLESKLPNEVDWALNKLVKISLTCPHTFHIGTIPGLVDILLEYTDPLFNELILQNKKNNYETRFDHQQAGLFSRLSELSLFNFENFDSLLERTLQILHIFRNLSFIDRNAIYFVTKQDILLLIAKGVALPSATYFIEIKQHCIDIAENIATHIKLRGSNDFLFHAFKNMVHESDRSLVLASIRTLTRFCVLECNAYMVEEVDASFYKRLLELLLVHDEEIIAAILEFLYQYSSVQPDILCKLASLDKHNFVNLISKFIHWRGLPQPLAYPHAAGASGLRGPSLKILLNENGLPKKKTHDEPNSFVAQSTKTRTPIPNVLNSKAMRAQQHTSTFNGTQMTSTGYTPQQLQQIQQWQQLQLLQLQQQQQRALAASSVPTPVGNVQMMASSNGYVQQNLTATPQQVQKTPAASAPAASAAKPETSPSRRSTRVVKKKQELSDEEEDSEYSEGDSSDDDFDPEDSDRGRRVKKENFKAILTPSYNNQATVRPVGSVSTIPMMMQMPAGMSPQMISQYQQMMQQQQKGAMYRPQINYVPHIVNGQTVGFIPSPVGNSAGAMMQRTQPLTPQQMQALQLQQQQQKLKLQQQKQFQSQMTIAALQNKVAANAIGLSQQQQQQMPAAAVNAAMSPAVSKSAVVSSSPFVCCWIQKVTKQQTTYQQEQETESRNEDNITNESTNMDVDMEETIATENEIENKSTNESTVATADAVPGGENVTTESEKNGEKTDTLAVEVLEMRCDERFETEQQLIQHILTNHFAEGSSHYNCHWRGCTRLHHHFKNQPQGTLGLPRSLALVHFKTHFPLVSKSSINTSQSRPSSAPSAANTPLVNAHKGVTLSAAQPYASRPSTASGSGEASLVGIPLTAVLILRNLARVGRQYAKQSNIQDWKKIHDMFIECENDLALVSMVDTRYSKFVAQILGEINFPIVDGSPTTLTLT